MRLKFRSITHFTDSMIVLGWIKDESRTDPVFVANRIGEIQTKTKIADWQHLPSQFNVADDISRGLKTEELEIRFIPGPEFLKLPKREWPVPDTNDTDDGESGMNKKSFSAVLAAKTVQRERFDIDTLSKFKTFTKTVRIVAVIMRFYKNVRTAINARKLSTAAQRTRSKTQRIDTELCYLDETPLTPGEIDAAKYKLLIMAQSHLDTVNYHKSYATLTPFKQAGLIRVGGRVEESDVSYDERHPVLLPKDHWLSELIVEHTHQFGHPGVASTAARVKTKYWIICVKKLASSVVYHCLFCREASARYETQFMANLPSYRLKPTPPFYHCACDLFGPYSIKISRNKSQKYWGVLFTCLTTRAVYADVTADYSAMEFLQTFRRFITIRGLPKSVLSDNASQLTAASKEITGWCTEHNVEWHFATPTAAHQNGCVESLVKSIKAAMNTILKDITTLTALEFQTLVFEAANLVNERPIGLLPSHPNDGPYICPNQILLGHSGISVPQGPFDETRDPRKRMEFVQKLVKSFWLKWQRDVFPTLVPRKKWCTKERDVRVDDIVLLSDPAPERGRWTKARVIDVFPGKDGRVRNVRVKTGTSEYERPINRLVVLLPAEEQT